MSKRIPEPEPARSTERVQVRETGDADLDAYVSSRDAALRDRLVVRYGPLVARVAARTAAGLPGHVERADLVSAGTLGLLEALGRFDPARGSFVVFAVSRIRGAMLDEVRSLELMPRSYWAKRREVDRVASDLGNALGRQPAVSELASVTGLPSAEVASLRAGHEGRFSQLDDQAVEQAACYDSSTTRDPEQVAVETDTRTRLRLAVDRLPDRPHSIITWYYQDGLTFQQIARRLGITESRVGQLHAKALERLKHQLRR